MSHGHAHDRAGDGGPGKERRLGIVALLTGGFMVAEAVGGVLSGSLALLADAGHMLTDFASLALAWFAARLARHPADWKRTYGFDPLPHRRGVRSRAHPSSAPLTCCPAVGSRRLPPLASAGCG